MSKHTPTPWSLEESYDGDGYVGPEGGDAILTTTDEAKPGDAAFVIRAVNAHDALVAAVGAALSAFDGAPKYLTMSQHEAVSAMRAALDLATEGA